MTTTVKFYANLSNARRAAKAAGLDLTTCTAVQGEPDAEGRRGWAFVPAQVPTAEAPEAPASEAPAPQPVAAEVPAPAAKPAKTKRAPKAPAVAPAAPATPAVPVPPAKTFELYGRSSTLSPVAKVHGYLDELAAKGATWQRRDALYALSQMGVNRHTARTQYQRWLEKRAGK